MNITKIKIDILFKVISNFIFAYLHSQQLNWKILIATDPFPKLTLKNDPSNFMKAKKYMRVYMSGNITVLIQTDG